VPHHQRTKANTEVAYLLMREAFERLGYRRVEWKCDALNERSRHAALRLGFSYEGLFRQHMIVKGRNRDTTWFSVIDAEWPDIRRRLEHWLYAIPTDDTGRPTLSLSQVP
jgi:RimJ/RimL family protein N-acetyltransferase